MDNSKTTHLSLCSGYGGIDLGLRSVIPALRTIAYVEREGFACSNLVSKMENGFLDAAPIWTDLRTFKGEWVRGVDIISGGYPCQPFSTSGKRKGTKDSRHLWPYIQKILTLSRPSMCFFENVEGHLSLGFKEVCQSLRRLGYRVEAGLFSAAEVGLPHQRKRVFILAHRNGARLEKWESISRNAESKQQDTERSCGKFPNPNCARESQCRNIPGVGWQWESPSGPNSPQKEWEPPRTVENSRRQQRREIDEREMQAQQREKETDRPSGELDNPNSNGSLGKPQPGSTKKASQSGKERQKEPTQLKGASGSSCPENLSMGDAKSFDGARQTCGQREKQDRRASPSQSEWQTEPTVGRVLDGDLHRLGYAKLCVATDSRIDELRLLGNGVVPATAAKAFVTLLEKL